MRKFSVTMSSSSFPQVAVEAQYKSRSAARGGREKF